MYRYLERFLESFEVLKALLESVLGPGTPGAQQIASFIEVTQETHGRLERPRMPMDGHGCPWMPMDPLADAV